MPYTYQRELDFTLLLLEKLRIPVHLIRADASPVNLDGGLRAMLGMPVAYDHVYRITSHLPQERVINKVYDSFLCSYISFLLPESEVPTVFVLGPYLTDDPSADALLEMAGMLGLPLSSATILSDFYSTLPIFQDQAPIIAAVSALCEVIWKGKPFDVLDINDEEYAQHPAAISVAAPIEQENILQHMRLMEERYAFENELMEIVAKGLTSRAESFLSSISRLNYQPRVPDPLRNMKNYCIICNTRLRKAAQQGGVHPLYLDEISSRFARTIETSPTVEKCSVLVGEMLRAYCRLVRTHASKQYSATIQKVLTYIDANLSGDLSLMTLSKLMQVTPSYLSTLFHRETGMTLANHITAQRMRTALHLLSSTHLQVQNIAQLSGYSDPNYFGKSFKRFYGLTPQQYRQQQHNSISVLEEHSQGELLRP